MKELIHLLLRGAFGGMLLQLALSTRGRDKIVIQQLGLLTSFPLFKQESEIAR